MSELLHNTKECNYGKTCTVIMPADMVVLSMSCGKKGLEVFP